MTVEPITLRDSCGDDLYVEDTGDGAGCEVYVEIQYRSPALSDDHVDQSVGLSEDAARKLRDWLTAWLDAPRLAAREHAEVVAEDDGVRLLKTSAGEWGVEANAIVGGEVTVETLWKSGEDAERRARSRYSELRGWYLCDGCGAETTERITTNDDVELCEACFEATPECDAPTEAPAP